MKRVALALSLAMAVFGTAVPAAAASGGQAVHTQPPGGHGTLPDPGYVSPQVALKAAARYLGVTVSSLGRDLRQGQSLVQVAKERHKKLAGLRQAVLAAEKGALQREVKDGQLTESQASQVERELPVWTARFLTQRETRKPAGGPPGGKPPADGQPPQGGTGGGTQPGAN